MNDYTDLKARLRNPWAETEPFDGSLLPAALVAIEELERDAERYLLLRNHGTDIRLAAFDGVGYWTGDALDAKLDKERGQ